MLFFKKKKVALVLGGGAARGLANLGVLKVFERTFGRGNLPFDLIVGTSIGSLIGATYCAGLSMEELERKALGFTWPNLVDLGLHPTGFLKGDKLESLISGMIGNKAFGDLSIPFALTTTDLETGEEYVHTHGDLRRLVRASCSWPGFFNAVEIDGKLLVDGGVRNPVPTKAACQLGATFVVAVNPGFAVAKQPIDNALKALVQSIQIMGEELTFYQARDADIAIKPDLHEVDQFGFDKAAFLIKQGETACEAALGAIKRKLRFHM